MTLTHRLTSTKETRKTYRAWLDIKRRCYDTRNEGFYRYGGRGITLQDSWINNPTAFCDYVSKLPNCTLKHSLDRIDNDLGYCEGNLRWATAAGQTRNQGKQANNTSGVCGVTWNTPKYGATRVMAWWWSLDGKYKSKSFSTSTFGLLEAFKMAVVHRVEMIKQLNFQGAGYSENHGK